jgi:hypothetical protein
MREIVKQGVRQQINVKMEDIEFVGPAPDLPQHREGASDMIANTGEPQALRRAGDQLRAGLRVRAGEQRDLMSLTDKLFGEPGHHTLGAAVKLRGHRLGERRYESDPHEPILQQQSFVANAA